MLTQEQVNALRAPFPAEALKPDTSRGFELTSIKAAYVIERLNEVFGPCGVGWRYVHSACEEHSTDCGYLEIVTEVALQFRFAVANDRVECENAVAVGQDWSRAPTEVAEGCLVGCPRR